MRREILEEAERSRRHLSSIVGDDPEVAIADRRYGFISGVCKKVLKRPHTERITLSDKVDRVVLHRTLGIPIFLFLMWLMFKFTFALSEPPMGWVEEGIGWLGDKVGKLLPEGSAIQSLVVDGVFGGLGSVLVFVPLIFTLFFCIAILEDSGYMARAAFVMDRFMYKIGLHGRSFIPMLLGFGCNIPGIMACRTIEQERDRLVTILVNPFMSCSARLPVYLLLIGAFFPQKGSTMLFLLYLIGIGVAILMAKVLRSTVLKGPPTPFVMELPPYRIPTLRGVIIHMWERGVLFLRKAGTVIFGVCLFMWFLTSFPWNPPYSKDYEALIQEAQKSFQLEVAAIAEALKVPSQQLETHEGFSAFLAVQREFEAMVEELEEGPEVEAAHRWRQKQLASLRQSYPDIYPLFTKYMEAKTERDKRVEDLERERAAEKLERSYAGALGRAIEPIVEPLGFNWKIGVSLVGGILAKEAVVGVLGMLYAVGEEAEAPLRQRLLEDRWPDGSKVFTPLVAFSLMIFTLLYVPCVASVAVIYRETNSWKWPLFAMFYTTAVAWIAAFIVYQGGRVLGT